MGIETYLNILLTHSSHSKSNSSLNLDILLCFFSSTLSSLELLLAVMKESILFCTSGRWAAAQLLPSLRPLTTWKEEVGEVSGEDEGLKEVLILVVKVRRRGILAIVVVVVEGILMVVVSYRVDGIDP
jgi:hypothetical protein